MQKMLIVEDEPLIRKMLSDYFEAKDWDVVSAADGQKAVEALAGNLFSMVLLDIMMPGMDGFEVCRKIRQMQRKVPIIFLTALDTEQMQLTGYNCGADDYVTKPFSLPVLAAKVSVLARRALGAVAESIDGHGIYWDQSGRRIFVDGMPLELPDIEYRMMAYFIENEGCVLSRNQILNYIWGDQADMVDRTVDKHLVKLRKLLGTAGSAILTIPKAGYRYDGREIFSSAYSEFTGECLLPYT